MTTRPLKPVEISDILHTVEEAQSNTRANLRRVLRAQGYPANALATPPEHILERLDAARDAEDELFKVILSGENHAENSRRARYNKRPDEAEAG